MTQEYTFTAAIKQGHLRVSLFALRALKAVLLGWRDCPVTITVDRLYATRSKAQNDLYWAAYIKPLADYTGLSPKWLHNYFKTKFLPKQRIEIVNKRTGVVVDEVDLAQLTTTRLTTIEFSAFLKEIEEWTLDEFHGDVLVGSNRAAA